jgi:hypothetical protein
VNFVLKLEEWFLHQNMMYFKEQNERSKDGKKAEEKKEMME